MASISNKTKQLIFVLGSTLVFAACNEQDSANQQDVLDGNISSFNRATDKEKLAREDQKLQQESIQQQRAFELQQKKLESEERKAFNANETQKIIAEKKAADSLRGQRESDASKVEVQRQKKLQAWGQAGIQMGGQIYAAKVQGEAAKETAQINNEGASERLDKTHQHAKGMAILNSQLGMNETAQENAHELLMESNRVAGEDVVHFRTDVRSEAEGWKAQLTAQAGVLEKGLEEDRAAWSYIDWAADPNNKNREYKGATPNYTRVRELREDYNLTSSSKPAEVSGARGVYDNQSILTNGKISNAKEAARNIDNTLNGQGQYGVKLNSTNSSHIEEARDYMAEQAKRGGIPNVALPQYQLPAVHAAAASQARQAAEQDQEEARPESFRGNQPAEGSPEEPAAPAEPVVDAREKSEIEAEIAKAQDTLNAAQQEKTELESTKLPEAEEAVDLAQKAVGESKQEFVDVVEATGHPDIDSANVSSPEDITSGDAFKDLSPEAQQSIVEAPATNKFQNANSNLQSASDARAQVQGSIQEQEDIIQQQTDLISKLQGELEGLNPAAEAPVTEDPTQVANSGGSEDSGVLCYGGGGSLADCATSFDEKNPEVAEALRSIDNDWKALISAKDAKTFNEAKARVSNNLSIIESAEWPAAKQDAVNRFGAAMGAIIESRVSGTIYGENESVDEVISKVLPASEAEDMIASLGNGSAETAITNPNAAIAEVAQADTNGGVSQPTGASSNGDVSVKITKPDGTIIELK